MRLHDLAHDRQPEPGAFGAAGDEWFDQSRRNGLVNAFAIVLNPNDVGLAFFDTNDNETLPAGEHAWMALMIRLSTARASSVSSKLAMIGLELRSH